MVWKTKRDAERGELDLSTEAVVMGILNVTPDSFSDGGDNMMVDSAVARAREMAAEGAMIIDVGGESTRPGAAAVSVDEEIARVLPVITRLRELAEFNAVYLSVDTSKAAVAEAGLAAGADIINDVTGCVADVEMLPLLARTGAGVVVMHMQGTPETMQDDPSYKDVFAEVQGFFTERLEALTAAGVAEECVCLDPGIGFGKTDAHNLSLLANIGELTVAGRPILLGVSRKSLFGRLLGVDDPQERDAATVSMTTLARSRGCMLHRVHEVKGNFDALRVTEHFLNA